MNVCSAVVNIKCGFDSFCTLLQTQNNVYEILSDVNSRQDIMDERIANLEDRLNAIQVSMDMLPDLLSRCEPK